MFGNFITLIKNISNTKGTKIFGYCYLYTPYADNTTFFLKDENFIVHLSEKLKLFFDFVGLKPNTDKCEDAVLQIKNTCTGRGPRGSQKYNVSPRYNDYRNKAIKNLGIYFSYNQNIKDERKIYNIISNIQSVLNLWRMRNFALEERMAISKR